jgi:hypothetical protein
LIPFGPRPLPEDPRHHRIGGNIRSDGRRQIQCGSLSPDLLLLKLRLLLEINHLASFV